MIWHKETTLPKVDLVVLPGGFSYGDYLRCGAIAAKSPIMKAVKNFYEIGGFIIGICNGFQILTETGLLKGTLLRNKNLKFINKDVYIKVINNNSKFTNKYKKNQVLRINIAHNEGNDFTDTEAILSILKEIPDTSNKESTNDIIRVLNDSDLFSDVQVKLLENKYGLDF